MIETMIRSQGALAPWSHTILRPSNPIGQGQRGDRGQGLVATILHRATGGEPVEIWGDGTAVRDYFDVRDLARAVEEVLQAPGARDATFNVSSGRGTSVLDVVALVEGALNRPVAVRHLDARSVDVARNVLDNARLQGDTAWCRNHEMTDTVNWMLGDEGR